MTGNELNPGDHLGGSEPQNHKLELRKVGDNKGVNESLFFFLNVK